MAGEREVVEQVVDAFNRHDLEAARSLFVPGAQFVTGSGRRLAFEAYAELLRDTVGAFPDLRLVVSRWTEGAGAVATESVLEGTHVGYFGGLAPTNRRIRLRMAHVWTVQDGRVTEQAAYYDTAGVLRQLASPD